MDIQLRRGLLEICVLTVLRRGDSYGYQLVSDVNKIIPITESTLYPILKRLESSGCVSVYSVEHNSRLRKYYHISDAGHKRIADFLEEWKEIMHAYHCIESEAKMQPYSAERKDETRIDSFGIF